jgi:hypothetical protein
MRPPRASLSFHGLEVVLLHVVDDLLAEHGAPCTSAVRKWIPPQTRASMISFSASEKRSKLQPNASRYGVVLP